MFAMPVPTHKSKWFPIITEVIANYFYPGVELYRNALYCNIE